MTTYKNRRTYNRNQQSFIRIRHFYTPACEGRSVSFELYKNTYNMQRVLHITRHIANVLLGIGCFAVCNESDTFVPNFIGLGCFVLLLIINKDKVK